MKVLEPSNALELIPQPLAIVTAGDPGKPGERGGMTAAWISRVSWHPPLVAIAMTRKRHTYSLIRKYSAFAVHVVSKKFVDTAIEVFGSLSGRSVDKFELAGIEPARAETVIAPIAPGFPVVLECRLVAEYEVGDHVLVIGEVVKGYIQSDEEPVVWINSSAREIK